MLLRVILTITLALFASAPAVACFSNTLPCGSEIPPHSPNALFAYNKGDYLVAAQIAEADADFALAARARIAEAITREEGMCLECLVKAQEMAQQSINRAATAESYVQLAVAIGFHGRLLTSAEAQAEGLADKGRAAIDRALELDPLNVWARAALGGWHLEIVQRAGPVLASVLYGATEQEGLKQFRNALIDDPDNLQLRYQYVLSILALDEERFHNEALLSLVAGDKDPLKNAMNTFTRKRAAALKEILKTGSTRDIASLVRKFQGYPPES